MTCNNPACNNSNTCQDPRHKAKLQPTCHFRQVQMHKGGVWVLQQLWSGLGHNDEWRLIERVVVEDGILRGRVRHDK